MGKIVLLDELTINQIAAGEVIERPASVIKEMVENSIDAGATNITVEIKNGGISYIRISDNGKGIAKDDVEMAFERHATSKIRSAVDLQDVKSMGFRGEALASIAAISNVELISKTEEQEVGTKIVVEGGDILNIEEIGCSTGTVITVRNLFYNTPVRYKFLKKDFTETGYIEDVITRIALVHPEIAIKLINSGKVVIQTNGNGELKSVIYSIYGKDIATEVIPVTYEYEYIKVEGVIGKPVIARSNRANQIFFVNKRYIKDKTLTSAIEQAFKGMIPIGKFAFSVLNIEMPPNKVDVNVHPAKLEVRFEEENIVFKAVYHAIKNTLLSADLISDREKNKEIKEASQDAFKIQINNNEGGLFRKTPVIDTDAVIEKKEEIKQEIKTDNMDVFERLKKLQQELKEQVEANPEIELTENYKKVEEKYREIAKEFSITSGCVSNYIKEMAEKNMLENSSGSRGIRTLKMQKSNNGIEQLGVVGTIACGSPMYAEENIETYISFPRALLGNGEFFILRANGESMIDAGIDDGDLVIIRKQETAEEGDIIVALINDEATLKRFYRDKKRRKIRLHPENAKLEDMYFDNIAIQGVAIKVIKDL